LPKTFHGWPTHFEPPDGRVGVMTPTEGPVAHRVMITDVASWSEELLGFDALPGLRSLDWLAMPGQRLAEVTGGAVIHDGIGELTRLRERLAWYPEDVWRYLLACQWMRIDEEEPFVGRIAEAGDELGSRVVTARLVRELMRLCLLLARRYPPYSKWLGTAFAATPGTRRIAAALAEALGAEPDRRQAALCDAYEEAGAWQNSLHLAEPVDPTRRLFLRPALCRHQRCSIRGSAARAHRRSRPGVAADGWRHRSVRRQHGCAVEPDDGPVADGGGMAWGSLSLCFPDARPMLIHEGPWRARGPGLPARGARRRDPALSGLSAPLRRPRPVHRTGLDHVHGLDFVASLVLNVPAEALADRVSRRALLAIGRLCRALAYALWTYAPSMLGFAAGFVLWGAGSALISGTFQPWCTTTSPRSMPRSGTDGSSGGPGRSSSSPAPPQRACHSSAGRWWLRPGRHDQRRASVSCGALLRSPSRAGRPTGRHPATKPSTRRVPRGPGGPGLRSAVELFRLHLARFSPAVTQSRRCQRCRG
jgi:hypothetical protein